ncbi:hypothetical protein Pmani_009888 [Petrolisthes manimaculis]|uniref:N-acetyltransferase domain-containing protein n=1 Tax=Petrolisthes manimaculis TaxID=1843537 RepID=A0AAE1UHX5_9EUCA|nr:hypothetical protein Pmani_009888 [Petrolisthes manimaculis]
MTTSVCGERVVLVPYRSTHVDKYHCWMQSPHLRDLTASEPLTLEEEYQMQVSWREDDDKCTFIVLDRKVFTETDSETEAMIGDTNIFLVDTEDRTRGEGEIMIAEEAFRGQGRGWEAMLLMFRYGVENLSLTHYQVKIGLINQPSIRMFTKMGFRETGRSEAFQEVTMEVEVDHRWRSWLVENTHTYTCLTHNYTD